MKTLDQGHFHPKLEVPRLTPHDLAGNQPGSLLKKSNLNSYLEHISERPTENARHKIRPDTLVFRLIGSVSICFVPIDFRPDIYDIMSVRW